MIKWLFLCTLNTYYYFKIKTEKLASNSDSTTGIKEDDFMNLGMY